VVAAGGDGGVLKEATAAGREVVAMEGETEEGVMEAAMAEVATVAATMVVAAEEDSEEAEMEAAMAVG